VTGEVFEAARRAALARAAAQRAVNEGATREEATEAAKIAAKKGVLAPVQKITAPDGTLVVPVGRRWHCELTGKSFLSRGQYENHLRSHRYRDAARAAAELRQRAATRAIEGGAADASADLPADEGSKTPAGSAADSSTIVLAGDGSNRLLDGPTEPILMEAPRI